ncbi:MAG: PQQ-dependent sugar dehydrogenase, partial [Actinobacteria bacterium]|nr:PQQ-dependent sugar dehydrogenase [Actinomycetota bacterium]
SWLYLYLTTRSDQGLVNRVERYDYNNDSLSNRTTIITDIPGASYHDGGRIAFGPDGYLYITTGDAGTEALAQDTSSLAGKTLRVADDGSLPADNPFGSAVYSYGHRNAQGITWDDAGTMWQTEHGRSGRLSGMDELNHIDSGKNYGWPLIEGDEADATMQSPVAHSGADETWAPAGITFLDGYLFFAGLRGESLYQARINDDGTVTITVHLRQDFGRLRAVTAGPDGFIYVSTSNTDGRGTERPDDDKIIRINPALFEE